MPNPWSRFAIGILLAIYPASFLVAQEPAVPAGAPAQGTPPPAPAGLTAVSGGSQEVELTWEASPGATSYVIYRSGTQNDTGARVAAKDIVGTKHTMANLRNDTVYYFRVKAVGPGGTSGFSGEASAMTLITKSPLPTGIYTLAPKQAPGLRLQTTREGQVTAGTDDASPAQQWTLTVIEKATYRLAPVPDGKKLLTAADGATADGAALTLVPGLENAGEYWQLLPAPGGYRVVPVQASEQALHLTGTSAGAAVKQAKADGSAAQIWNVMPVTESAPDPGTDYVPEGYKLVFADEFDGQLLNVDSWETLAPFSQRHLNDEIECYEPEAVFLKDGMCVLRAEERPTGCGEKHPWRSGAITSRATYKHGYFEARFRIPQGQGMWPAYWLTSSKRWPPEWDIVEIPNTVGTLYQYMHPTRGSKQTWVEGLGGNDSIYTAADGMPNPYTGFVIYGCEVSSGEVKLWVNGKLTAHWKVSPEDTADPLWVSLNLAVGGKWPGPPDATTPRPADMVIDYVRIYQKQAAN